MTVDPRISFWLNIVLTAMIGLSTGAVSLSGIADAATAKSIVAWCGLGAFILGAINTALFGASSSVAGRINAVKVLDEVRRVEIKPTATGIAGDMARDPAEAKVGIGPPLQPAPVDRRVG